MRSNEAYQALLGLILADEPNSQDGMTWDRTVSNVHAEFQ
jgi:hypothetical protein